jgi:hypothetical protein
MIPMNVLSMCSLILKMYNSSTRLHPSEEESPRSIFSTTSCNANEIS